MWGAALGLAGAVQRRADLSASGERGVHAATLFSALASAGLVAALAAGNLTYRYVANWTSFSMAQPYRMAALWAGPSGSLLVWALVLGVGTSLAALTLPRGSALRAWTVGLLALLLAAILAMACFDLNPFKRLAFAPEDGRGLPLEWLRPVVLVQMPLGYLAMAVTAIPAVMTVMGALGVAPWRDAARRWAFGAWALCAAAIVFDWRRRYGDAAWADEWRWAPVESGTGLAWAGAALLVAVTARRVKTGIAVTAGFFAFALGIAGLTMRRAIGWTGAQAFAASDAGHLASWMALVVVVVLALDGLRARSAVRLPSDLAARTAHAALLIVAAALLTAGFARTSDLAVREGERARVVDRFGTGWTLSLEGVSQVGREAVLANVIAVRAAVNGKARAFLTPEVRSLYNNTSREPVDQLIVSGISTGLAQDLRIDVREANLSDAVLTVRFIPAVAWLWIAGAIAVLTALLAAALPSPSENDLVADGVSNAADDTAPEAA